MVESTLVSFRQKKLGPIMETLGRLRKLEVIEEDAILIPKIMAIGNRLSEKTSLTESSTGLTLPRLINEEISSDKRIIILNVVLAQADFEAIESTCMTWHGSRVVDTTSKKTLSDLTKCDRSNENLYMKGVGALGEMTGEILYDMVLENYQDLVWKIDENFKVYLLEQRTLQSKFAIDEYVMATFIYVVGRVKEILDNMLVRGEIEYINGEELNG
ncbi:hypothetical protein LXL04_016575 [Taraxacum kok-saghyz]